ncbi:MAG: hypothetical protein JXR63_03240 [Spirochaetales bacterium]|nr:hypothetical protein [Spirochaetales bacterium]
MRSFEDYIFIKNAKLLKNELQRYKTTEIRIDSLIDNFNKRLKNNIIKYTLFSELNFFTKNIEIEQEYKEFILNAIEIIDIISAKSDSAFYSDLKEWIMFNNYSIFIDKLPQIIEDEALKESNNSIIVKHYLPCKIERENFTIEMNDGYNNEFKFIIKINVIEEIDEITLRIPGWTAGYTLEINNQKIDDAELIPPKREQESSQFEKANYITVPDLKIGENIILLNFCKLPYTIYDIKKSKTRQQAIAVGPFLFSATKKENIGIDLFDKNLELQNNIDLTNNIAFINANTTAETKKISLTKLNSLDSQGLSETRIWFKASKEF